MMENHKGRIENFEVQRFEARDDRGNSYTVVGLQDVFVFENPDGGVRIEELGALSLFTAEGHRVTSINSKVFKIIGRNKVIRKS